MYNQHTNLVEIKPSQMQPFSVV